MRIFAILWVSALLSSLAGAEPGPGHNKGAEQHGGEFINTTGKYPMSFFRGMKEVLFAPRVERSPADTLPLETIDMNALREAKGPVIYRLGHSSMLIKLAGQFVLVDPVFSQRASPVQWIGPKRFHPVPLNVADLPDIAAVVISHDHYDHLDKQAIKQLAPKVGTFLVPLGVGKHLREWGVADTVIAELDWWQSFELDALKFVATPAQHFSGRSLSDRNETLWASWVIQGEGANLFFSGDSGYFDGFREIGDRYGPFDVTMIENGAYNDAWRFVHMMPEESVQAHIDLRGKAMLPIHNSTFDLSTHRWYEPLERVTALALARGVTLLTPVIGVPLAPLAPEPTYAWWRDVAQPASAEAVANATESGEACQTTC